ncbi:metal ABC transporter solute-binding protein, Zn/Mn family [Tetragenococcus muriaticus]|uniref:metal ABC transporter solute-binding protein, Zn/Mn family n=1 Tax=Tetragenococcus muriaticus TaxID=64642 RepID=UPI0004147E8B|nr:zinc ABC transporter substrate-binding protein [Tetragenococcus muriaticus]GMA46039.1 metal transporter [Tetragenococcus muriaticus]GMA47365.1 metal transporter [Tetragenococcus muriaticus]
MKKSVSLLLTAMSLFILAACGGSNGGNEGGNADEAEGTPTVTVTTSFLQDMVTQLAGDQVEIEQVIPAGEDPHLYVATPDDMNLLESADLVLYHGLHFEGQMVDALENTGTAVTEEVPESELTTMEEDGSEVVDPHFWFDIDLYKQAVDEAADELVTLLDDENITENAEEYKQELDELDQENADKVSEIPEEGRYLITPHDAFNYFAESYGMEVVAPQGVSTESEASNADISATVDFIVDNEISAVFAESTTDPARMERLQEDVEANGGEVEVVSGEGQELFSDSLAPVGEDGDTYIDMYRHNVDLIVEHLR